jgi:cell wall-associated NlpC family hydrolase
MPGPTDFVRCAKDQLGKPYVYATAGPNTFDCSGLVAYCWEQTQGEPLTRSSHQQYLLGEPTTGPYEPGDLLFWGNADHVAIYEGSDHVIHALNHDRDVIRSHVLAPMGIPFLGARRLFTARDEPEPEPPKARRRKNRRRHRREP